MPHQLILFGPPGTSKSHTAKRVKAAALEAGDPIAITFHPEFSYGEFVARLLPISKDGKIEYRVQAGPFLRALARAYAEPAKNVVLLIDEINRGNCAEIFGDVFQLLDREPDGVSSYPIDVSELIIEALRLELARLRCMEAGWSAALAGLIEQRRLSLPPNFYLIATMNTSDESIYFMDTAFKRRWHFEFMPTGFKDVPDSQRTARMCVVQSDYTWEHFLNALNAFIVEHCTAPKLDDKLVGPWFIKSVPWNAKVAPTEVAELRRLAPSVGESYAGADNSLKFETALLDLARTSGWEEDILAFAQFKEGASRSLEAIAHKDGRYYKSKEHFSKPTDGKFLIETFVDELEKFLAQPHHVIERGDVIGKLFLYLWDNVFDRDKGPLAEVLGLERRSLRTFGQFVEHADEFIERMCRADTSSVNPDVKVD